MDIPGSLQESAAYTTIGYGSVLTHLLKLYREMKIQDKFCHRQIPALLAEIIPPDQFSLSPKDLKRSTKYYQLALNLVCDNIYRITSNTLTADEHKSILLLSVFCPLFDDLFDEHLLEYHQVEAMISSPEKYTSTNPTDIVVHRIYQQLLQTVPDPQRFKSLLSKVAHWEQESMKQLQHDISEQELMKITYQKSYYSILFCCAVLNHYPDGDMLRILFPVSGLMQLTNDCFDVWKDSQQGLFTIPNLYRNYEKLEKIFLREISSINSQVAALHCSSAKKRYFLIRLHTLHAMGWMSLQQLKALADIPIKELSRKQLVCDLDSLPQQLKWIRNLKFLCNKRGDSFLSPLFINTSKSS